MADKTTDHLICTLLAICEKKHLSKITLTELLQESNVSRTAFSNRFKDLNDLITTIWLEKIIEPSWNDMACSSYDDYYLSCLISNKRKIKYRNFVIQACEMSTQNNLRDYMLDLSIEYDKKFFGHLTESGKISERMADYIARYNAYGVTNAVVDWLTGKIQATPEEFAKMMSDARFALLTLADNSSDH